MLAVRITQPHLLSQSPSANLMVEHIKDLTNRRSENPSLLHVNRVMEQLPLTESQQLVQCSNQIRIRCLVAKANQTMELTKMTKTIPNGTSLTRSPTLVIS